MHDVATLLAKASQASPPIKARGTARRWVLLLPVFTELRSKGFSGVEAVSWLIQQNALKEEERKQAFYGLHQASIRKRRRDAKSSLTK